MNNNFFDNIKPLFLIVLEELSIEYTGDEEDFLHNYY